MNKKAYMFTVDATIAAILLIIGIMIIAGFYFYAPDKDRTTELSDDITNILMNVRLYEICPDADDCSSCSYPTIEDLCSETPTQIKNREMSLMEFFGQLYHDMRRDQVHLIVKEIFIDSNIIPYNYDMQVLLEDPINDPGVIQQIYPEYIES